MKVEGRVSQSLQQSQILNMICLCCCREKEYEGIITDSEVGREYASSREFYVYSVQSDSA